MKTLDQLQQMIHSLYKGNASYPSYGESVYTYRTSLLNMAIQDWGFNQGVYWRELFTNLSDAGSGDTAATANDTTYSTPTDFMFISSFVKITASDGSSSYYRYVKPDEFMNIQKNNTSEKVFYITGSNTGKAINIQAPIAGTLNYSYYKTPTELSAAADKIEMSKPLFAVYSVVEILYEQDLRNDMVNKYQQLKKQLMDEMILANDVFPYMNPQGLMDLPYELTGQVIGL